MRYAVAVMLAGTTLCTAAGAQQMPAMPGMSMPGTTHPHQTSMPGQDQIPKDLAHPDGTPSAQGAASSMANSIAQQRSQQGVTPAPGSDAGSLMRDAFRIQENEAPEMHSGSERPAPLPDLLAGVGARKPLTLTALLATAAERNPTIAEARASAAAVRGEARQAGLLPDPEIGYSAEHIRGGEYGGGEQGGYVSQRFLLGGKLGLRRQALNGEARAGEAAVQEQSARVRASVSAAFYRVLVAQAQVAIAQRLHRVAVDASETAHQLANLGQADAPDVLAAEVEAERAGIDLVHAQRLFMADFRAMAVEAGAPELPLTPLGGDMEDLPAIDPDASLTSMLVTSPAIARAHAEVAAAEIKVKAAQRESAPDLTVKAGEWSSGERIESSGRAAGAMGFVDAGLTVPLWNRNRGDLDAAQAELAHAQAELRRTELQIRRDAAPLTEQYAAATFESGRYRDEILPRARRAYELSRMKYQQMAAAYPQVLVSERTLFQLQSAYLESLGRAWAASVALENFTLSGGLDRPDAPGRSSSTGEQLFER